MQTETVTDAAVEGWLRKRALYRAARGVMDRARAFTISVAEIEYVRGAFAAERASASPECGVFRAALAEGVRVRFG